jgi:hypothetical protein
LTCFYLRGFFFLFAKDQPITIETARDLSRSFQMSLTATAIKLVRFGSFPSMLVYYENGERKWFIPSAEDLPKKLWPSKQPDKGCFWSVSFVRSREWHISLRNFALMAMLSSAGPHEGLRFLL